MNLIDKTNTFLARFVGPNAAHMIDAVIAVALVSVPTLAASHAARVFLLHHAVLGLAVSAALPLATALASKFRKAAGSSAPLADQLVAAVTQAVSDAHDSSAITVTPVGLATTSTAAVGTPK